MKNISIGLLTYKRTDLLLETIQDIVFVESSIDLIIVNNNEDTDIKEELIFLNDFKNINLIYIWDKINYGVAKGRNKIIEVTKTPFLILFDDDVVIPNINTIINNTIQTFKYNSEVGAIAFHIKDYQTKLVNKYEIPHKNKKINLEQDFDTYLFIGAGHALKMSIIEKTGGYPDDFGLYGMEEIDLAFRIIGSSYRIRYVSDNIIYHKRSPNGRHSNDYIYYLSFLNRVKIAIHYFQWKYVVSVILVRGFYLLYRTKKISFVLTAIPEIYKEIQYRKNEQQFTNNFYRYIKDVDGFLWW